MQLTPFQLIEKKRNKEELSESELKTLIDGLIGGEVADYQMAAMLMAIYLNGMTSKETAALTKAMLYSGEVLKFSGNNIIDKHSTGGVGDKTSFIVAPIAAACGVKVPMVAGRGLGHTGGTVDKIESIPGYHTNVSLNEFSELIEKHNVVLSGQTSRIAPADRKIYSLRDVTATIDSVPLITASILSKKLAEGINGLVMDIKYGTGAFLEEVSEGEELAKSMAEVCNEFGVDIITFITDMNQPLGRFAGHSLEVIESIETLKGNGPKDLEELSLQLAGAMIYLGNQSASFEEGVEKASMTIKDGTAFKYFKDIIAHQGGDLNAIENPWDELEIASEKTVVKARSSGFINYFDNKEIGLMLLELGGGRKQTTDVIDFAVGLEFHKKLGDEVKSGDEIFTFYHHKKQNNLVKHLEEKFFDSIIKIEDAKKDSPKLIEKIITNRVNK